MAMLVSLDATGRVLALADADPGWGTPTATTQRGFADLDACQAQCAAQATPEQPYAIYYVAASDAFAAQPLPLTAEQQTAATLRQAIADALANWATLTAAQKDAALLAVVRAVARRGVV